MEPDYIYLEVKPLPMQIIEYQIISTNYFILHIHFHQLFYLLREAYRMLQKTEGIK